MPVDRMRLIVETRTAAPGEAEPVGFLLGDRRIAILEIVDRWPAPEQTYYKVLADDGALYILRREAVSADWDMTFFRAMA